MSVADLYRWRMRGVKALGDGALTQLRGAAFQLFSIPRGGSAAFDAKMMVGKK